MSDQEGHPDINYKKIYFTLLGLLVVSVAGPFLGIMWVTLLTAFGIAFVKAGLVVNNFMHLRWEKRMVKWLLVTSLVFIAMLFAGTAADIMNHEGHNWQNLAAMAAVERGLGDSHGEGEGEAAGGDEAEAEPVAPEPAGFSAEASYGMVCSACHGVAGDGAGAAGAALDPPPADFTDPSFWEGRDRDRIITGIRDGGAAVGGSALMAPWGALYDADQLEQMADYVISFRPNG